MGVGRDYCRCMPESLTPRAQLRVTLRELAWTIHRRAPGRAGVGPLPTSEIALLKQVLDGPGATIGELAAALGLQQPNVSTAVRLLQQRGFVVKETDPSDGRIVRIFATDRGASEHRAITDAWTEGLAAAFDRLTPEHQDMLDNALDALQALNRILRAES